MNSITSVTVHDSLQNKEKTQFKTEYSSILKEL